MKMTWLFPVLVAGTISLPAIASEELGRAEIRQLVDEGQILALEDILEQFPPSQYGKLLDLEVERNRDTIVYEFEFLGTDDHITEIKVDASTGTVLKEEIED